MPNQTLTLVQAINLAFQQEMEKDKTVMVLGEDVGKEGGVFRVTEGLQEKFGKERVIDTPLAESGVVGMSIGLAINGMKPVAEIQFSGFFFEAFPQLTYHAARMRNRSRGRFSVPMVVRLPYGGGIKALEHHSESEEALLAHTPGLKVVIPSTPFDAKGLLISAIRDKDTVIFMEPKRIYRAFKQEVPEEEYFIPIGKAATIKEGTDLTLIAWGGMVRECQKAAVEAGKQGINCEIIDVRTIYPMDKETIINSVKKTGRAIIVQEAPRFLGTASEISTFLYENLFHELKSPIERVTGLDIIMPLLQREDIFWPDKLKIMESIKKIMKK